jgi:hypothetical protein
MWCSNGNLMAHVEQSKALSRKAKLIVFLFKATETSETTKGAFGTVPDSLWIRNISVSLEKWFSVELESPCKIVLPVCWNVLDLVKMRRKWIRITWNTYFVVSWLPYKNLKRFKPIHLWNVSIFSCLELLQVIQVWIWNVSLCQTGHKGAFGTVPNSLRNRNISFSPEKMILGRIRINLWSRLARLLKRFRFSENEKEVNQNHLKHLFCRFTIAVKKLETFQINSALKYFHFSPFGTAPSNSSLNQKRFSLPNGA